MSIALSLSNALSGLNAASRGAELVSSNVANAMTEGYGRRDLQLGAQSVGGHGGGVTVNGISRNVDQGILRDRRLADAELAAADVHAAFYGTIETALGEPGSGSSLSDRLATLDAALIDAASGPESDAHLRAVADAAGAVAAQFNTVSDAIQAQRVMADSEIARQVSFLNDSLVRIDDINERILVARSSGKDAAALMDQRQMLVDGIAGIVPLNVVQRDNGQIALYSASGAVLLDGRPAVFGFASTSVITPDTTLASGALSGLTLNDIPIQTSGTYSPVAGGSLAALFEQRDVLAPAVQADLDALARDLVGRFQDPALDPTLSPGDAGLFTDGGTAFDSIDEVGLSARLALNPAVDPAAGGALWRLRDGLGAAVPGAAGDATLLNAYADVLVASRSLASGSLAGTARDVAGFAAEFLSVIGGARQGSEAEQGFAASKRGALHAALLEGGVDTDQEMQKLLLVEQAYAANARVIQTIDEMLQSLMRI